MAKLLKYIFLILFAGLWFLGCSKNAAIWLNKKGFIEDDYRFGDLYRLSSLPQFKVRVEHCSQPTQQETLPINFILIGDSFTEKERLQKEHFVAQNYERLFIGDSSFVQLRKDLKNVLIIETVERHFRERFSQPYKNLQITENTHPKNHNKAFWEEKMPYNTERHEAILFSNAFFMKIKEIKALFNWKVLGRTDNQVAISPDGKHLFYGLDVEKGIHSIFDEVSDQQINQYVQNINATYDYYKNLGFDEVIFSIAPNKTSIYGQNMGSYNHLIERVQKNTALRVPFIDVYIPFIQSKQNLYDMGDSHWNCEGKQIWIDKVNEKLKTLP